MSALAETIKKIQLCATEVSVIMPKEGEMFHKVCEIALRFDELVDIKDQIIASKNEIIRLNKERIFLLETLVRKLQGLE